MNERPLLGRRTRRRHHNRHQQHHQPGPPEEHRTQIFQGVIRTEDIQKNLMNDFESQYNSDSCSDPVHIKEPGVISQAVNRKHHAENDDLRNYVGKKDGELAMQFSPKHHPRHRDLQGGVCQPEYVVGELRARAH